MDNNQVEKNYKLLRGVIVILPALFLLMVGFLLHSEILETLSACIGFLSCCLNSMRKNLCFIFYFLYSILYAVLSFMSKQYGEAFLSCLYLFPLYSITLFNMYFRKNKKEGNTNNRINRMNKVEIILAFCLIPALTIGVGFIFKAIDSNLPFINALSMCICIISSYLSSRKKLEQWFFWTTYSFVSGSIWIYNAFKLGGSGYIFLVLNIFCLLFNVRGMIGWFRGYEQQKKDDKKIENN